MFIVEKDNPGLELGKFENKLGWHGSNTGPAGNLQAVKKENAPVSIVSLEVQADPRVRLIETLPVKRDKIDLASAEKVVCVGMGLDKQEDMKMAEELAQLLGAEIACTRGIAEERQWLPVESYIGISGAKIKPSLYISMGVSGQVQHVVGIRDSKIIVAVDSNEKAPIIKAADYSIIGDMYEIIPLLIEELKKA
jgi:electron transfer flavoprotein alpha subunit